MMDTTRGTIVPDVRFPNEVKAIQDMGGIVIRLTRCPIESDDLTETALNDMETRSKHWEGVSVDATNSNYNRMFDHLVDNTNMSIKETNEICLKIAKEYIDGR